MTSRTLPLLFVLLVPPVLLGGSCVGGGATGPGSPGSAGNGGPGDGGNSGGAGNAAGGTSGGGGVPGGGGSSGGTTGTGGSGNRGGGGTGGTIGPTGTGGMVVLGDAGAPVNLNGRRALFIVSSPTGLDEGDAALQAVLTLKGMTVTLGTEVGPATMANGQDVIIASGAASAADFALVFKDVPVPMIVFGNAYFLPLGFIPTGSANRGSVDSPTALTIVDATTHLTSDLVAGSMFNVIGTTRSSQSTWGLPGGSPIKVAAVTAVPTQLCVFAYETGAAMATGTAPARRVAFGWRSNLTQDLSVTAFKVLTAAVEWTAGGM